MFSCQQAMNALTKRRFHEGVCSVCVCVCVSLCRQYLEVLSFLARADSGAADSVCDLSVELFQVSRSVQRADIQTWPCCILVCSNVKCCVRCVQF